MTHNQVVELILKTFRNRTTYDLLKKWDESRTLYDNCGLLNRDKYFCRGLASRYGLKFQREMTGVISYTRKYNKNISQGYIKKWDTSKTLAENAKRLGVSISFVSNIANNYGLSWTKHYKHRDSALFKAKQRKDTIRRCIKGLRDKGMTLDKIGKVYGITRERVRQILL